MMTTMIVAVVFHLLNTGAEAFPLGVPKAHSYNFELAAMYVLVLGYFTVSGAGKYSVDEQVLGGEFNLSVLPHCHSTVEQVRHTLMSRRVRWVGRVAGLLREIHTLPKRSSVLATEGAV